MEKRSVSNIETLFLEIVELPESERVRVLEQRCGGDDALRSRVERLLRADEANHLGSGLVLPAVHWPMSQMPKRVGGYVITGIAGEGGTGTVFDSVHETTRRRAAIKLIRSGMASMHERQRLAIEAETLGRLSHEGIARLYEAGVAEIIWPDAGASRSSFIAMEFIENAVSITQFARDKALSQQASIRLIAQIAKAVHHAHQRGVIHRDLKPGNVLVNQVTGVAKIVDFGIARLTDADVTAVTQTGQVLGTLRYMSPEQASADPKQIDARTDIYSLGAMLYELLSGRPVIDAPSGSSAAALVQLINSEPPRLMTIASQYKGDLDAIVHKAISREPDERYSSAAALAEDLERYLDGREVSARAPTVTEQLVRVVRRNKAVSAATVLVMFSVAGGGIAATWGLLQAERARQEEVRQRLIAEAQTVEAQKQKAEADKQRIEAQRQQAEAELRREEAEAVTGFVTRDILGNAGPATIPDKAVRDVIVQKLIDPAAADVGERFKDKPLVEAAVRSSIGRTYNAVGRSDLALDQEKLALEIHRRVLQGDDPRTLSSMNAVGFLSERLGRFQEAEQLYRETLELRTRVLGNDHLQTLISMNNLGTFLLNHGDAEEGEKLLKTVLEKRRVLLGNTHPATLNSIEYFSFILQRQGKLAEAEVLKQEVIDVYQKLAGMKAPETLRSMNNMANLKADQNKLDEAAALFRQILEIQREVLGDTHPDTLLTMNNLAYTLFDLRQYDQAQPFAKEAAESRIKLLGERHPDTLVSMSIHGLALHKLGQTDEAHAVLTKTLEGRRAQLGDDHTTVLTLMDNMSFYLQKNGRFEQALPLSKEVVERVRLSKTLGPDHRLTRQFAGNYAKCLEALSRPEEAAVIRLEFKLPPPATQPASQPATQPAIKPATQPATLP